MVDFFQNSSITTLHSLNNAAMEKLEANLIEFAKKKPIALVIPSLYSELQRPALSNIICELQKTSYINEVIIGLDQASKKEFDVAKNFFRGLKHYRILWHDGSRLKTIHNILEQKNIAPQSSGKGKNMWYCLGYLLASNRSKIIAAHDADIVTYSKNMLTKLLYPIVNVDLNYQFSKGYYFRVHEKKLMGRVMRLLVSPLIQALKKICGTSDYLEYLNSFRYPLAGEFATTIENISSMEITCDWSIELAILSEVYKSIPLANICQVDIADVYDHKHQAVSVHNSNKGLAKMSIDIIHTLLAKVCEDGVHFTTDMLQIMASTYQKIAMEFVKKYQSDAIFNNYKFDFEAEKQIVDLFSTNINNACKILFSKTTNSHTIPSWKQITNTMPDFLAKFYNAVEEDNAL